MGKPFRQLAAHGGRGLLAVLMPKLNNGIYSNFGMSFGYGLVRAAALPTRAATLQRENDGA